MRNFKSRIILSILFYLRLICVHICLSYTCIYICIRGEHLSTMYTHALWATKERRAHLLETKYFSCHCKRCADPTELGTYLGSLKCPQDNGFISPKNPLDFDSEWGCDSCPGTLTAAEVTQFVEKLEEDVDDVMRRAQKDEMLNLLSR